MNHLKPETEKSLIDFPCEFTIKTFGKASQEYELSVLNIIKEHAALNENAIRQRYSKGNNYLALSITIDAESKEQLDHIYQALSSNPLVIMAL